MYLKSLELSGFKSFAEPTDILLEPGITGIVGPNGCGKSNTVDAIRWCLGELSPRTLRSKSITDVIFNGTRRLSPAAYAQVTMTFDNSDHALDISAGEVAVSRKVFRDGTSEYSINKSQCRLKDIKALFLGTGLGDDGYSIMEGSMVEFLLTAKPHERRLLFDEASGAAKFASRRDEAISKMEKIDTDLDRVKDQIELIGAERKRLEGQAKKAKLYERLMKDKTGLEIKKVLELLAHVEKRSRSLREEVLEPKRSAFERASLSRDELLAEIQKLESGRLDLDQTLSQATGEFHDTLRERDLVSEKIKNLEDKIRERETTRETLLKELKQIEEIENREAAEQSQTQALYAQKLTDRDRQIEEFDRTHPRAANPDAAALRREAEKGVEQLKHQILDVNEQITKDRNENLEITAQMSQDQAGLKYILREHKRQEQEKAHCEEQRHALEAKTRAFQEQIQQISEQLSGLSQQKNALLEQIKPLEHLLALTLPAQKASLEARLEQLEKSTTEDAVLRGARAIQDLANEMEGISGPIGKLIKCPPQHYGPIKEILGERLYWFLADNQETAMKALRILEERKLGRAAFVLQDRLEKNPKPAALDWQNTPKSPGRTMDLEHLLGTTDDETKKTILAIVGPTFVQGWSVFGEALVRGGQEPVAKETEAGALTQLQEQQALQRSIEEIAAQTAATEGSRAALHSQIAQIEQQGRELQGRMQESQLEAAKSSQALSGQEQSLKYAAQALLGFEKDAQENLSRIASRKERLQILEESLRVNAETLKNLQSHLENASKRLEEAALEISQAKEAELSRELAVERASQEVNLLEQRKKQLEATLAEHRLKKDNLAQEDVRLAKAMNESRELASTLADELRGLESAHAQKAKTLEELQTQSSEILAQIRTQETQRSGLEEQIRSLEEEIRSAEMELRSLDFDSARAKEEACRIFNTSPEEVQAKLDEASQSELTARLREGETPEQTLGRINHQIERLGQINFLAQPEYERLGERMTFLESQREDILKARTDVQTAISKINSQIEESFETTFSAVRAKFKEIFAQLFEGGEADLAITEADDLRQKGVEIFVQPPGKKLQNLAQLSQGEKALTAVSLLFAFFSTRPAPVCVLDEIDAPLDEANVLRFRKLLQKFAQRCQFIIITHNKKTMEASNNLYGVTMEELGVSKIISVKLEEAAASVA